MLHLSLEWLAVALGASVKSVLLAGTAALVLRLPRLRDNNARHRVWTGVLIGMLLFPALSRIVPTLHMPLVRPIFWKTTHEEEFGSDITVEQATGEELPVSPPQTEIASSFTKSTFTDASVNRDRASNVGSFRSPQVELDMELAPPELSEEAAFKPRFDGVKLGYKESAQVSATASQPAAITALSCWPVLLLAIC